MTTEKAQPAVKAAVPAKEKIPPANPAPKDSSAATKAAAPAKDATQPRVSTCVVNDGRGQHVGNAVNGKVCSYHAMHYDARGDRR